MSYDLHRWPEADDILDAALALPRSERMAYVRKASSDPELVSALAAVLAEAEASDGFLDPAAAWSGPFGSELRDALTATPTLDDGTWIEHYEVIAHIGSGGMGEVYRARDHKLGREVALKVLPGEYATDPERQARFQREARVLASINHPNIGAIYGIAEATGVEALVLELVEGPTLAEVIASTPLGVVEAIQLAAQIAEAMATAHRRGVLHRDLKPANIKITDTGSIKILDFGLARVLGDSTLIGASVDLTRDSPHALLGTASYMSPEQAKGQQADERSDIWAFGCILFEMLARRRAFSGGSVTEVLAAVIERDPDFSLLPANTPDSVQRLVRRCLQKDPERRLGFIGDARLDLLDALQEPTPTRVSDGSVQAGATRWRSWVAPLLAAVLAAAAVFVWTSRQQEPASASVVSRLAVPLPTGDAPVTGFQPMMAIAPGGSTIIYRARRGDTLQLFRRDLDTLEPTPIPGTEGATNPVFSPDGQWLAFDADGVLKRIALTGGAPVVICDAPGGVTAAWLDDDTIVFATNTSRVLQRVPASGGTPEAITALDAARGETLHLLPEPVPDRRALLFTSVSGAARHLAVLDLDTRDVRIVGEGSHARFIERDVVVFARAGALWASRFDTRSMTLTGNAIPLDERVAHSDNTVFHYAAARGSLVYLPPQSASGRQRLVWMDRAGRETPVNIEPRGYVRVSLSPDDQLMALALDEDGNQDIWVANPARNTMSRLTVEPTIETMPTFSPDGKFVAFRSEREGPGIFRRDALGSGGIERLTTTDGPIHSPYSWTPDGQTLLLAVFRSFRNQAIARATLPDMKVEILLDGDFAQLDPQVSPDGRWMAYQSDETGRFEIYVRPYPDVEAGRWLVSSAGGTSPRWSADGRELFYHDGEGLVRIPVKGGASFAPGRPERLFAIKPFGGRLGPDFEVASDGQRFLFLIPTPDEAPRASAIVLVQNAATHIKRRLETR